MNKIIIIIIKKADEKKKKHAHIDYSAWIENLHTSNKSSDYTQIC